MPLTPGQVLKDRYRIAKLLAQGGFGAVYRAWDLNLNTAVALKENLTTSAESLKQFTLEARLLASLRQENLPYVIDYFSLSEDESSVEKGQYLVMEFVEGKDLQSMLEASGPLDESQAVSWFSQVCNALIYLHSQTPQVIHRDIKPANIKITPKGQVMLVDFGIAKVYDPSSRTTAGARAVTQGFSPPEQYGSGRTDVRSDIYALGATLYAALTAQTPLDSLQRRLGHELPPPGQINPKISPGMEQVILRAIELDPTSRYPNVRDFKQALTTTMISQAMFQGAAVKPIQRNQAPASNKYPVSTPQGMPATQQSPLPASEQFKPPGRESTQERAAPTPDRSSARHISGVLMIGIVACLLIGILAIIGGAAFYFSTPPATKTRREADLSWATQTMHALITMQTRAPTLTFTWTPTVLHVTSLPPSWTPTQFYTPTPPPSYTPVPSFTPTPTAKPYATWYPCTGTYPSRLHVGDLAHISSDPPLSNRVREQPNTSSEILGMLEVGERMEILEGPVCFGGWIWWRVRSLEKYLIGWTAEGDETDYWIVPEP